MNRQQIIKIEETTSTLTYIRDLQKKEPLENGFTVYTDFQSAGRGQKGSSWESARGENLMFSTILFPDNLKANKQFILSQIVSLSIADVLSRETADISIKWANDIYWKEKKITGILIENDIMDDMVFTSVLGVGINLNQEVFLSDAPNPVSLKQITGKKYDTEKVLTDIINSMESYFNKLSSSEDLTEIKQKYKQTLFRRKGLHPYSDNDGTFYAEIYDVEDSGLLVLKTEAGELRKYAFKEVKFLL